MCVFECVRVINIQYFQLGGQDLDQKMKMKVGLLRWKTMVILVLMLITVLSPIFLYTDTRFSIPSSSSFILDPIRMFFSMF